MDTSVHISHLPEKNKLPLLENTPYRPDMGYCTNSSLMMQAYFTILSGLNGIQSSSKNIRLILDRRVKRHPRMPAAVSSQWPAASIAVVGGSLVLNMENRGHPWVREGTVFLPFSKTPDFSSFVSLTDCHRIGYAKASASDGELCLQNG